MIDPSREILTRWPGADKVGLLREAGVSVALVAGAEAAAAAACRSAGITPIAEVAPASAAEARVAGFAGVAVEASGAFADEKSAQAFVAGQKGLDALVFLGPQQIHWKVAPAHAVLRAGLWPGVRSGPNLRGRDIEVASASREPWVDANPYLIAYLKAKFPDRAPLLGYGPDKDAGIEAGRAVPFDSLELALVEAFVAGGNFVLSLEEEYYKALVAGDSRATAAWRSLAQTVRFLTQHREWFRRPTRARVAVAAGTLAESGELLNLMYRRNLCPVVLPVETIATLSPARYRAVVVANLPPPAPAVRQRILGYARAGGLVITSGRQPWWTASDAKKTRADEDRDLYALGKGQVIAYRAPIADPSEFALDVVDAVGVRTRDLRLWNAGAVIGIAAGEPGGREAFLHLVNYGSPRQDDFPARIDGAFAKATLEAPGAPPKSLAPAKRGSGTEVTVDGLGRLGVIRFE